MPDLFRAFLQRPPRLLANPVCAIFSSYYAYVYACIFCFIVTMYVTRSL